MQALLAHAGHEHGPDMTVVVTVVLLVLICAIAAGAAIARLRE